MEQCTILSAGYPRTSLEMSGAVWANLESITSGVMQTSSLGHYDSAAEGSQLRMTLYKANTHWSYHRIRHHIIYGKYCHNRKNRSDGTYWSETCWGRRWWWLSIVDLLNVSCYTRCRCHILRPLQEYPPGSETVVGTIIFQVVYRCSSNITWKSTE